VASNWAANFNFLFLNPLARGMPNQLQAAANPTAARRMIDARARIPASGTSDYYDGITLITIRVPARF
jgi:hypothetical protein